MSTFCKTSSTATLTTPSVIGFPSESTKSSKANVYVALYSSGFSGPLLTTKPIVAPDGIEVPALRVCLITIPFSIFSS